MTQTLRVLFSCLSLLVLTAGLNIGLASESDTTHSSACRTLADSFPRDKRKEFLQQPYGWVQLGQDVARREATGVLVMAGYMGGAALVGNTTQLLFGETGALVTQMTAFGLADYLVTRDHADFVWRSAVNIGLSLFPYENSLPSFASRFLLSQLWLLKETVLDVWQKFYRRTEGSAPVRFMNAALHQLLQMTYTHSSNGVNSEVELEVRFLPAQSVYHPLAFSLEDRLVGLHKAAMEQSVSRIILHTASGSLNADVRLEYRSGRSKQASLSLGIITEGEQEYFTGSELGSLMQECVLNQLNLLVSGKFSPLFCTSEMPEQYTGLWSIVSVVSAGTTGFWLFDHYLSQGCELPEIWLETRRGLAANYQQEVDSLEWMRRPAAPRGMKRLAQESLRSAVYQGASFLLLRYLKSLQKKPPEDQQPSEASAKVCEREKSTSSSRGDGKGVSMVKHQSRKNTVASKGSSKLERFVQAQDADGVYQQVLDEIGRERKKTHWIWYVYPQLRELGTSSRSWQYGIKSIGEAERYLEHPELGPRLRECAQLLLDIDGRTASQMFGSLDAMKLQSSMTLFEYVAEDGAVFSAVLEKYFTGVRDQRTLDALQGMSS